CRPRGNRQRRPVAGGVVGVGNRRAVGVGAGQQPVAGVVGERRHAARIGLGGLLARGGVGVGDRCAIGEVLRDQAVVDIIVVGGRLAVEVGGAGDVAVGVVGRRGALAHRQHGGNFPPQEVVFVARHVAVGVGLGDEVAGLVVGVGRGLAQSILHR